jgi:hypothetical protein
MLAPKLTDEMRQALAICPTGPIPVEDAQTNSFYVLLTQDDYCRLHEEHIRKALAVSIEQAARGELTELRMSDVIAEANRRYDARLHGAG